MSYKFVKLGFKPSENIKEAHGDNGAKVLKLTFHNNKEYIYHGLEFKTIDKGMQSDSVGEFFASNIRNNKNIKYERIK